MASKPSPPFIDCNQSQSHAKSSESHDPHCTSVFLQIAPKGGVLRMTVRLVAFSSKKPNEAPLSKLYQLPSLLCSVPLMTNEKSISYAL